MRPNQGSRVRRAPFPRGHSRAAGKQESVTKEAADGSEGTKLRVGVGREPGGLCAGLPPEMPCKEVSRPAGLIRATARGGWDAEGRAGRSAMWVDGPAGLGHAGP